MDPRLRERWDAVRTSYWFVPSVMTVTAALVWAILGVVDQSLRAGFVEPVSWLYNDTLDAARALLFAVAAAMVGIIGVVFSITTVPLTIAASQFGPRLLRTFLRDTGTQMVLGTFVATFVFCMLVLLELRDKTVALPQLSVTIGLALALVSLGVLIYFINHVAVSMQAPIVIAAVSAELHDAITRMFPLVDAVVTSEHMQLPADLPDFVHAGRSIIAQHSGYVQARADAELVQVAVQHDLMICVLCQPGDFVTQGTPLVHVWPPNHASHTVAAAAHAAFVLGPQRTLVQDIVFGINELVEVALRALSPAINDPFTAITCIDWLGSALCQICVRTLPPSGQYDAAGQLRLLVVPLTFARMADAAFNQIREYGRTSTAVTVHLLDTIAVVSACARTDSQRVALLRHAQLIEQGSHDGIAEEAGRQEVAARFQVIEAQLTHDNSYNAS